MKARGGVQLRGGRWNYDISSMQAKNAIIISRSPFLFISLFDDDEAITASLNKCEIETLVSAIYRHGFKFRMVLNRNSRFEQVLTPRYYGTS